MIAHFKCNKLLSIIEKIKFNDSNVHIQSSASECVLDCLLAARAQMIRTLRLKFGDEVEETTLLSKLMAYCSKEAHSCVEKAAMIGFVKLRILEPDENCSLRGHTLREVSNASTKSLIIGHK